MAFDGLLLNRILQALKPLEGAKVGKIQNLSEEEVLFHVHHRQSGNQKLAISVHPNSCRLYLSAKARDFLTTPTSFVMVLRKYLSQAILTNIEQAGFDRIVCMTFQGFNEFADPVTYKLYAELMGKYANLILTDADDVIIDCLKRIPVYENSRRLIHPGAKYSLPEKPARQNPLAPESIDMNTSLVSQMDGYSPQLSREVMYRLHQGQSYEKILKELYASDVLYLAGKDFHCLKPTHLGQDFPSLPLMEGLENLFEKQDMAQRKAQQCGDVIKIVHRELKKHEKKLVKLEQSLEESRGYDKYRRYGDILFANLHLERVTPFHAMDYETGEMTDIDLDMRYSLKDNAQLFYKKYRKLKRGVDMLEEQAEKCRQDIDYFLQMACQLDVCSVEDALEIRNELAGRNIVRQNAQAKRRKTRKGPNVLHLDIYGAEIYAGKNNIQNNEVTWKLSSRQDLWFHVKDYHGCHVLLKSEQPTEEQIRFCACLAAYYSKGRHSSSVPVDYTTISQLKKIPGSPMGMVSMKSYKTIYIDPDASEIEKLIETHRIR